MFSLPLNIHVNTLLTSRLPKTPTRVVCLNFGYKLKVLTILEIYKLRKKFKLKAEAISKLTVHSQLLQHFFFVCKCPRFGQGV